MRQTKSNQLEFRTSSFSAGTACVAVAAIPGGGVHVKHSKDPKSPVLAYTQEEWRAFVQGVKNGEFDV